MPSTRASGSASSSSPTAAIPRLHVELPDGTRYDDIYFALVTNTDPWTYVGNRPLRPTPDTGFDTGLGLYARRRMGTAGMLFSMARLSGKRPRIGRRGRPRGHDLDGLTVLADDPTPVQVDGDYLGPHEKLRVPDRRERRESPGLTDIFVPINPI